MWLTVLPASVLQQPAVDLGDTHRCRWWTPTAAIVGQRPGPRQCRDLHRQQRVGRVVADVAEAEVSRRKGVGRVLGGADRLVGPARRVVHRGDIDRDRVRARVEIRPAIGRAAVVLHLEGEAGIAVAIGIDRRRKLQQPASDVGDTRPMPRRTPRCHCRSASRPPAVS